MSMSSMKSEDTPGRVRGEIPGILNWFIKWATEQAAEQQKRRLEKVNEGTLTWTLRGRLSCCALQGAT